MTGGEGWWAALALPATGVVSIVGAGGKTSTMFRLAQEIRTRGHSVLTTTTTKIYPPSPAQSPATIFLEAFPDPERPARVAEGIARHRHVTVAWRREGEKAVGLPAAWVDRLAAKFRDLVLLVEADGAARRPFKVPAAHEPVFPGRTQRVILVIGAQVLGRPLVPAEVHRAERMARWLDLPLGTPVTPEMIVASLRHPEGYLARTSLPVTVVINQVAEQTPQIDRLIALLAGIPGIERIVWGEVSPVTSP